MSQRERERTMGTHISMRVQTIAHLPKHPPFFTPQRCFACFHNAMELCVGVGGPNGRTLGLAWNCLVSVLFITLIVTGILVLAQVGSSY